MTTIKRKLVIVGDGAVGKTCLLTMFSKGTFPEVYVPTVFEEYTAELQLGDKKIEFDLHDTAGQDDYDRLRPLAYPDSHVVLICFAIDNPDSLDNVQEKWMAEVAHFAPKTPTILVGCKTDLRDDPKTIEYLKKTKERPVPIEEGQAVANKICARVYVECSSLKNINVQEVFIKAGLAATGVKHIH